MRLFFCKQGWLFFFFLYDDCCLGLFRAVYYLLLLCQNISCVWEIYIIISVHLNVLRCSHGQNKGAQYAAYISWNYVCFSSVIINYITCFQVYVPLLWKILNRWDQTNIPIGCLTQMRTVCRHLYFLIKINAVFFTVFISRYFVPKLPFCQMYNSL